MISTTLKPVRPLIVDPPRNLDVWVLSRRMTESTGDDRAQRLGAKPSYRSQSPVREFAQIVFRPLRMGFVRG
ncbi:MAG: hypothetical protein KGJ62_04200 [Armatimonadetes bacterium]|nr:hypothetical protein [Armatimonadota bacterium]MDE2205683.1 hypothetical protein [Armatimonadota bacterium]